MNTSKKPAAGKKAAPRLKNYSSEASESSIFEAIRKSLAAHKAKRIMFDYDDEGRATSIEFVVELGRTSYTFKLPARFEEAEPLVAEARKAARMGATSGEALSNQAYRAVWATIRDWVDAQMALIDIGASRIEEVFLPYLVVGEDRTLFEEFAEQKKLPPPSRVIITEN